MSESEDEVTRETKEVDLRRSLGSKLKTYAKSFDILRRFSLIPEGQAVMIPKARKAAKVYKEVIPLMDEITDVHDEWLSVCGLSEEELEELEDFIDKSKYAPSKMDAYFSKHDEVIKASILVFQRFAEENEICARELELNFLKFPENSASSRSTPVEVPQVADFVAELRRQSPGFLNSTTLSSAGSMDTEERILRRLHKVKADIEKRIERIEKNLAEASSVNYQFLLKQLEAISKRLETQTTSEVSSLIHQLEVVVLEESEVEMSSLEEHDQWRETKLAQVESLQAAVIESEGKRREERESLHSHKQSLGTYFQKRKPPSFNGEFLDYLEFKDKWTKEVSSLKPPESHEIVLLKENLPAETKLKLFNKNSLEQIWKELDKLYGDKMLLSQKLKIKMKNITTSAAEDHEKVIEVYDLMLYLSDRLRLAGSYPLLSLDPDYLAAVYSHLPDSEKFLWDTEAVEETKDRWEQFNSFLEKRYNVALRKRVTMESLRKNSEEVTKPAQLEKNKRCEWCKKVGHTSKLCRSRLKGLPPAVEVNYADARNDSDKAVCPMCSKHHSFTSADGTVRNGDRLYRCESYNSLSVEEKAKALETYKACAQCTSWTHLKENCRIPNFKCGNILPTGLECDKQHNKSVCGASILYVNSAKLSHGPTVMLVMQDIPIHNSMHSARAMYDSGSNGALITHACARKNKIPGRPASFTIESLATEKSVSGMIYDVNLVNKYGQLEHVSAYGVDKISKSKGNQDASNLKKYFPDLPKEIFDPLPPREVEILIGTNYSGLHPGGPADRRRGHVRIQESLFGSGWVISGSDVEIGASSLELTSAALRLSVNKLQVTPTKMASQYSFWIGDGMGVEPPLQCSRCKDTRDRCKFCNQSGAPISRKEAEEREVMIRNMKADREAKRIIVSYPFCADPGVLGDNRSQAEAFQMKQEKRRVKEGNLGMYNEEFKKYIERGALVEIPHSELDSYQGVKNYVTHQGVYKDSVTTPLRVVSNSSFPNGKTNLNSLLVKGPQFLNDLVSNLIRFRSYEVGVAFDISKAYNALQTTIVERFLRLVLWREDPLKPFRTFGFNKVQFGDKIAGGLMQLGIEMASSIAKEENTDPRIIEDADKLVNDIYVDDGTTGGYEEDAQRMIGDVRPDGTYTGSIPAMLQEVGFNVKVMVRSGANSRESLALFGGKLLGYNWDPTTDIMSVPMKFNLSGKFKGKSREADVSLADLGDLASKSITRRNLMAITNGVWDPLGIASPYTVKLKLAMKDLIEDIESGVGWDAEVSKGLNQVWRGLISEGLTHGDLEFQRSTRPSGAVGKPHLIGFWDGSFMAFGTVIYISWMVRLDGVGCNSEEEYTADKHLFKTQIVLAKTKVTPLKGMTIPRAECSALLLCTRALRTVVKSLSDTPKLVTVIGDSECVINAVSSTSSVLKPFFHNRVGEICENISEIRRISPVEELHHCESSLNPADLLTRNHSLLSQIGMDSLWQVGPPFLTQPRPSWPITRDFVRVPLPEGETRRRPEVLVNPVLEVSTVLLASTEQRNRYFLHLKEVLEIREITKSYSNLLKLERILALVIAIKDQTVVGVKREDMSLNVTSERLTLSRHLLLVSSMIETRESLKKGNLVTLNPVEKNGILVTRGRIGERGMYSIFGVDSLPIVMPTSRLAYLIMRQAHEGEGHLNHRAAKDCIARSRNYAWIPNARKLADQIVRACMVCKRRRLIACQQRIGDIPVSKLVPCPPWTSIAIDYAGPFLIRDVVKGRTNKKCWAALYACANTRAVKIYPVLGYKTDDFLICHENFVANHGVPSYIQTDRGTQLVKAGQILAEEKDGPNSWDWLKITHCNSASNWTFVPVGSHHRNGLPEVMIKMLKKSLQQAVHSSVTLNFAEFTTLLSKIANCMNDRPLGLNGSYGVDELVPLTPNMMLLGRNSDSVGENMRYAEGGNFMQRVKYVEDVYQEWWARWSKDVLPALIPVRKWREKGANLQVGDICAMISKDKHKTEFRLVKVLEVFPDLDNLVRTVRIGYRRRDGRERGLNYKAKALTEELVAVQRLAILVPANGSE